MAVASVLVCWCLHTQLHAVQVSNQDLSSQSGPRGQEFLEYDPKTWPGERSKPHDLFLDWCKSKKIGVLPMCTSNAHGFLLLWYSGVLLVLQGRKITKSLVPRNTQGLMYICVLLLGMLLFCRNITSFPLDCCHFNKNGHSLTRRPA